MTRIIVVEDEQEKRRLVISAILECANLTIENITFASDSYEAKRHLSIRKFDLLILDINIPKRADERVTVGGGLDVLNFIRTNPRAIAPSYVLGLTAYEDGFAAAQSAFSMPLWKLLIFSFTSNTWRSSVKEAVQYLQARIGPPTFNDGRTYHCDVGIIVALEGEELDGLRKLPLNWHDTPIPHDASRYISGSLDSISRKIKVVAVASPKMGMSPAAITATKLIANFRPRVLVMTGICAGVRGKVALGDILIADPCFDWGSGKWIVDIESSEKRFLPAAYQWRLNEHVRSSIRAAAESPGLLQSIHSSFNGKKPEHHPSVYIDAMASGASILQSEKLMAEVRSQHKNLIGVEMESYAVLSAAEYSAEPRPISVSIKSVCDYGDNFKNDEFHEYAVHTSSEFLLKLLELDLLPIDR